VGRPLGAPHWVAALEARLGVRLTPKKRAQSSERALRTNRGSGRPGSVSRFLAWHTSEPAFARPTFLPCDLTPDL
jgi:hypothetical protein